MTTDIERCYLNRLTVINLHYNIVIIMVSGQWRTFFLFFLKIKSWVSFPDTGCIWDILVHMTNLSDKQERIWYLWQDIIIKLSIMYTWVDINSFFCIHIYTDPVCFGVESTVKHEILHARIHFQNSDSNHFFGVSSIVIWEWFQL